MTETTGDAAGEALQTPAASAAPEEKAGLAGWYTVIMMALVVMLAQIDRNVISLLVQPMKRDLHLSDTHVSLLIATAFTLFYVIVGPPVSRIADRGLRRAVVSISLAVWSVATAMCGLAQNFWQLFLGRAVIGGAEAGSSPAAMSMIADVIPRNKLPRAYAIYTAGFLGGGSLALILGGFLLAAVAHIEPIHVPGVGAIRNWQLVFIILGLPGVLVSLLIMLTLPEPRRRDITKPKGYPIKEVAAFVWANRAMHAPLLTGMLLNSMQNFATVAWAPAFYERTYGWGPAKIGPLLGTFNLIGGVAGLFLGAAAAEWFGKRKDDANIRVFFFANVFSIPLIVAQPLMPNPWLAMACGVTGLAILGMGGAGYNSALQVSTPNAMRAQINALYLFVIAAIGGGVGPTIVALLTDFVAGSENDLRYVLSGFRAVLGPVDAFLIWLAMRPYGKAVRARIEAGD